MPLLFLKTQTVQTQVDKETMILLRKKSNIQFNQSSESNT